MKSFIKKNVLPELLILTILFTMLPSHVLAYESTATWKTRYDSALDHFDISYYSYGYSDTDNSAYLAWSGGEILDSLHKMYETTGDTGYIAKMSTYIDNMYNHLNDNDGDGYLGWGTDKYNGGYYEYVVHFGMILTQWAKFILTVKNNPTLAGSNNPQGITYLSQANELESVINSDLIPKWNRYFNTEYGVYTNNWLNDPNQSIPHNMYLIMATAMYLMSQVTESNQRYRLWADEMVSLFKEYLTNNGSTYSWRYANDILPGDNMAEIYEDYSHATLDLSAAFQSMYSGGVFDERDMSMFSNTIYDIMWNQSTTDPQLNHNVNGTGVIDGYIKSYAGNFERWRSGIWGLLETWTNNNWGNNTTCMLNASVILQQHPANPSPQSFLITSPANLASNLNSTVSFSWQPSINAADYTLQVAADSAFNNLIVSESKITGTNAVVPGLSHSTTYYWRVIARNAAGATYTSSASSFTTKAASTYTLTFSHLDNRGTNSIVGYHYMQALINDEVVWEKDVATDGLNTWYDEAIDITNYVKGKSNVDVKFRLLEKSPVTNYVCYVYFDNVNISNADITNGGFEESELWQYHENQSGFTGDYSSTYAKSGTRSYILTLPQNTITSIGDYCEVNQKFELINPTLYRLNLYFKDSRNLSSPDGYHYKQILIDDTVVWEQDAGQDGSNWINTSIDVSPYCIGKSNFTVKLRLYDKSDLTNYSITTYLDSISITNTNLQNGNFEESSNWTYEENYDGFAGEYSTEASYTGNKSFKIYLPANTVSSAGNYCGIYQTCSLSN